MSSHDPTERKVSSRASQMSSHDPTERKGTVMYKILTLLED